MKTKFPYFAYAYISNKNEYLLVVDIINSINSIAIAYSLSSGRSNCYYLSSIKRIKVDSDRRFFRSAE